MVKLSLPGLVLACLLFSSALVNAVHLKLPTVNRQDAPCPINNVCFVLDQSGSMSNSEYAQQREFVKAIADQVVSVSSTASFSSVAYSTRVTTLSNPTTSISQFKSRIDVRRSFDGSTNIGIGLSECADIIENEMGTKVIILLTDGEHNSGPSPIPIALDIKNTEIAIVSVGIGDSLNEDNLHMIASQPNLYIQSDFEELPEKVGIVADAVCEAVASPSPSVTPSASVSVSATPSVTPSITPSMSAESTPSTSASSSPSGTPSSSPSPQPCPIQHVCFALDRSGSISTTEYWKEKQFVAEIARIIDSRNKTPPPTRFSGYVFASDVSPILRLGSTGVLSDFLQQLDDLQGTEGSTLCTLGFVLATRN